jgi:translation initiation factor IF-2
LEVVVVDPKGTKAATDGTKVTTENVIGVAMKDLSEKDREEVERELQHELEEEMAERQVGMLPEDLERRREERGHGQGINSGKFPFHFRRVGSYD